MNRHAWTSIPGFWVSAQGDTLKAFLNDKANAQANAGYLNILSAKIVELKELPLATARSFTPVDAQIERYGSAKVFYVGIDYRVHQESKYFYNGVNYRFGDQGT